MTVSRSRPPRGRAALAAAVGVAATGLLLAGGLASTATSQTPPEPFPAAQIHAPSPVPDRIVLTPTADTSTSQSVTWRTDAGAGGGTARAQISPMAPGPDFDETATTVLATQTQPLQADLGYPSAFHTVTFEGLEPDTAYLYRVGDGSNWSEWFEFETAGEDGEPFSFIYYGDAQNEVKEHVSRVFRKAFTDRPQADLLLHAGDLVDVSTRDEEWGEWFDAAGWIDGMVNNIATTGNHEYRSGVLSPYWDKQFEFPANGPGGELEEVAPETIYHVDYQGVRFVSLNTNLRNDRGAMQAQAEYLDRVLTENPHKWSVVTFHHPAFSTTGSRNNPTVREFWVPVLDKHDVDLVLQGHDHSYARGNLVNDRIGRSMQHDGSVYVVSVSGAKMYELNDGSNWTDNGAEQESVAEGEQLYQLIDVSPDGIAYEARTADGEFHDGFTITKRDDGSRKRVRTVDEDGRPVSRN